MSSYIRLFGEKDQKSLKRKIRFFVNGIPYFIKDKDDILLGKGFGFRIRPPKFNIKPPKFNFHIKPPKFNFKPPKFNLHMPQFNGGKLFHGITSGLSSGLGDLTSFGTELALAPTNLATGVASGMINSGMGLLQTANPLLNAATSILSPGGSQQAQPMDDGSGMQSMDDGSGMQQYDDGSGMQQYDDGSGMQQYDDGSGMQQYDDGSGMQSMDDGSGSLEGDQERREELLYTDNLDQGEYGL